MRSEYSEEKKERDKNAYTRLVAWGKEDTYDPNNYWNSINAKLKKSKGNPISRTWNAGVRLLRIARIVQIRKLSQLRRERGTYGNRKK